MFYILYPAPQAHACGAGFTHYLFYYLKQLCQLNYTQLLTQYHKKPSVYPAPFENPHPA